MARRHRSKPGPDPAPELRVVGAGRVGQGAVLREPVLALLASSGVIRGTG